MSRTKREAARERAERVRREMEDRVLAGAARLRADDHSLEAEQLRERYPRFDDFIALRDRLDPKRVFGNRHLERILGA